MEEGYDLIILGAGPAGITAAIYAARARLHTLWLEKKFEPGGQIGETYQVDNYPGLPGISGSDLGEAMAAHAEKLGMKPLREAVVSLEDQGEVKLVHTRKNTYRTKTLILSCGATHKKLGVPGEEELSGSGVSYCAACDGAFFKDKTVAVAGGGNAAVEDVLFLSRVCRKVYLIHRRDALRADRILQERMSELENVTPLWYSRIEEIRGETVVEAVKIRNLQTGEEEILPLEGVFVAVGIEPCTGFLKGFVDLDQNGYIVAGEDGVTSVPGVFAAGDIRTKALRQVVTAVSDGASAVHSVLDYLLRK